jgi:hypothetical protein
VTSTTTVTLGGLAIGLFLLVRELWTWWRGGSGGAASAAPAGKGKGGGGAPAGKARDPKALLPFATGIAFGALCVACPAGLLGTAAGLVRSASNGGGGLVMQKATGQAAPAVAQAAAPALTPYGAFITTVVLFLAVFAWKKLSKVIKGKFRNGVWAGTLLTISSGVLAFIGATVIPVANSIGSGLVGAVTHGNFV